MGDWERGWQKRPQQRRQYQQRGFGSSLNGGRDGHGGSPSSMASSRRPPPSGGWRRSASSWEKDFCYCVGVPWKKVLEAKELMPVFRNIVQWDDSAGEEAFQNAKMRFWAWNNHVPCDIPLPDPDMYNDHIDWNWKIDPELVKDLENKAPLLDDDQTNCNHERSGWDSCLADEPIRATGWVVAEESTFRNLPGATVWGEPGGEEENLDSSRGWTSGWGGVDVNESGVTDCKSWGMLENNDWRGNLQVHRQSWKGNHSNPKINGKKREGVGYGWCNSRNARSRPNNARDFSRVQDSSYTWKNINGAG